MTTALAPPPFPVGLDLAGWTLLWMRLELVAGASGVEPPPGEGSPVDPSRLAALRAAAEARARSRFELERLPEDATVAAVRALFRAAGCDPTRHRPSSEALLRRVLKGDGLPVIHPLVDLNNCLSLDLAVPCSVAADGAVTPPVTLRAGRPGEEYASLRGPFHLDGKPLLADAGGPFSTPITDSQRIKVQDETRRAWVVAYLPAAAVTPAQALACLEALLRQAPLARLELAAASIAAS